MKGSTFRRCACRNPETGKQYGQACPKLSNKRHGQWNIRQELPPREDGTRRTFRRSGYATKADAQTDLDKVRGLLSLPDANDPEGDVRIGDLLEDVGAKKEEIPEYEETARKFRTGQSLTAHTTVGEWLDQWLASKKIRKKTATGYESIIRLHLKPRIGHIRLDRLNVSHLVDMFDAIIEENETILADNQARREQEARAKWGKRSRPPAAERERLAEERAKLAEMKPYRRPTGAASRQRIRAALRNALNTAIAHQHITFNPASYVEMDSGKRPKPLLWTPERVKLWQKTGQKPSPVMVWTPEQLGTFLDHAEDDRLYALFHLIAFRGLRRGEAVGQDWANLDLDAGLLTVSKEIVTAVWDPYEEDPKTEDSAATIGLDSRTVAALRAHGKRQRQDRRKWGEAWQETGKVFTQENGEWLHPEFVSDAFRRIRDASGLPPINLRDLRHCAATVMHGGGGDLHYIKETLRHSTITLTSDTYTSLLLQVDLEVAEAAADLVPRKAPRTSGLTSGSRRPRAANDNNKAPRRAKPGRDAKAQVKEGSPDPAGDRSESRLSDSNRRPSVYKTDALTS